TASTSRTAVSAFNGLLEVAQSIGNPEYREVVLGMLRNPSPSFLGGPALDWRSYLAAGGAGAHHKYPGGLPVHTFVNLQHALNILETYEKVYATEFDRDLVVAAVILHDVLKAYTNQYFPQFNEATGKWFAPPVVAADGLYKAWGRFALMGHHNELLISELAFREAPPILVATAHSHQDQYWDSRTNAWLKQSDETWERTMEDGLKKLAQFPGGAEKSQRYLAEVFKPQYKSMEAGINLLSDSDWNMSQGKAGIYATQVFATFAQRHGLVKDTREYNLAQGWLFSRVDPTRIAAALEAADWDMDQAVELVESVFLDPGPYECEASEISVP
ncbi:MAG: hypothetical protein ACM3UP_02030, partial [Methanocella sp.]